MSAYSGAACAMSRARAIEDASLTRASTAKTDEPHRKASPATDRHERNQAAPSVLVVEDNSINQRILVAFLRKRGYAVDVANDGAEAVQRLALKRYS
ncbi:MAG: hypothetical protein ACPL7M_11860, partial [Bryobacteraceae bacterium]